MRHPACRELFDYWRLLCAGRAAPERDAIDPAAIRGILADVFILEVDAPRAFPFRLSGARLNALLMREQRGASFLDLWRDSDAAAMAAVLEGMLADRRPVAAGVTTAPPDHARLDLELLLLPLRHRGKTHARVLGCLAPARVPGWFGLLPAQPLALASLRVLDARASEEPGPRRGHLVVHAGGRAAMA